MPAAATGRSSEGEDSVKAAEGPYGESSIVAPAMAGSAPPETRRVSRFSSVLPHCERQDAIPPQRSVKRRAGARQQSALTSAKECAAIRPRGEAAGNDRAVAGRPTFDRARSQRPLPSA